MKKILALFIAISFVLCPITAVSATNNSIQPLNNKALLLENEANEKYNKLLLEWAYDKTILDDVDADFPYFYGGAYIDPSKQLVIQVTEINDAIVDYFKNIIDIENVSFQTVKYSYSELKSIKDILINRMNIVVQSDNVSIIGVGISFPQNTVDVYVNKEITKDSYSGTTLFNEIPYDSFRIIVSYESDNEAASVEPGTEIANSIYTRSVGFWATTNSGTIGIVTAPHSSISSGDAIKIGGVTFGYASTPYFSGSVDAVFVPCSNTSFTATRYVSGWGFSLNSGSTTVLAVGSTTYSKGKKSGCQSGTIIDVNYTTSYGISNCVVTTAPCASGDSGGVVAGGGNSTTRHLTGIVTGTQGTTHYLIYVKAQNILSTLGIYVY